MFETWSKKKSEWLEREAYADPEKPLPKLGSGDLVRYVTQSNFIVQYEILERHAYEFSEYDEEDETEEYQEYQEYQDDDGENEEIKEQQETNEQGEQNK